MRPAATEGWNSSRYQYWWAARAASAGIVSGDHRADRLPDELKRLPVAACGKRIPTLPVPVPVVGIPVAGADAFDQFHVDAVALDRQRVKGIAPIQVINGGEVGFRVLRQAGRGWKCGDGRLSHRLPQRMQTIDDRRAVSGAGCEGHMPVRTDRIPERHGPRAS